VRRQRLAFAAWPAGWVLVIHTRYDAESSAYVDYLRKCAAATRVWFSLRPVPRQDYDPLIDGAEVGLAFYVSNAGSSFTQRNVQTIGLSSGQLAYYLRAGLPVMVNQAASIADVVDASGCGLSVADAQGIAPALKRIADEYAAFSTSAARFFDERLDFRRAFSDVLRRVDHVHERARALEVREELVAEADALARALDQPGHVGDDELPAVGRVDRAQHRLQRRERVVGDLRRRVRDAREERRLACVRKPHERRVREQLEVQLDVVLLARRARRSRVVDRGAWFGAPDEADWRSSQPVAGSREDALRSRDRAMSAAGYAGFGAGDPT